jgi:hypothetical protein
MTISETLQCSAMSDNQIIEPRNHVGDEWEACIPIFSNGQQDGIN